MNDISKTIDVNTRFIIRGRAYEVSLIDDFTIDNVRILTVCETVANSLDDLENDIAYNKNSDILETENPIGKIKGEDIILIGDVKALQQGIRKIEANRKTILKDKLSDDNSLFC